MSQPPEEPRWPTYQAGAEPSVPEVSLPAVPVPPAAASLTQRPGYVPNDPLVFSPGASGLKKEGVWTVPPYLKISGDMGTVRLDFRRAVVTSPVIWVDVSGGVDTIVLVLPEGWAAQLDRVQSGWGTRKSSVAEERIGDNPVLVITGSLGMGTFRVRYPNRWDERRLRRQLAREQKQLR